MIPLKYATASQEVPLGFFLDSTDGDTEETGLTIANTDIWLWKAGATTIANKNSGGATHIQNGIYYCTLDATDTDTYGPLIIFVHESGALTVRIECVVMNADAYDALYAADGTGHIEADAVQVSGDGTAADNLELACDNYSATRGLAGTALPAAAADAAGGLPISDLGGLDLDTQIGTDIDAILADTNELQTDDVPGLIGALNDPTAAAIADAVWDEDVVAAHNTADTAGALIDDVDDILTDTGTTLPATLTTIEGKVDTVDTVADAILLDTGTDGVLLTATATSAQLVDDVWDEVLTAAAHNVATSAGRRLRNAEAGVILAEGTAQAGAASTITLEAGSSSTDDIYNHSLMVITGGTGAGQAHTIQDYNGTTLVATVAPAWRTQPDNTSTYSIHAFGEVDVYQVETGGITASSFAAGAIDAAAIATDAIGAAELAADAAAEIVDAWETQSQADPTGFHVNVLEIGGTAQTANDNGADINAILADTNELQTDWADGGRLDNLLDGASAPSAATVADAVWDEAQAGHVGAGTFGEVATEVASILADTNELQTDDIPGTLTTIEGKIDTVDTNVDAVLVDTGTTLQAELDGIQADTEDLQAQIGTAGAGLTAVPWNANWDAEVQSEVTDAIVAHNLDHLALTATAGADMTTEVADNTILSRILANGDTSAFDPSSDGLQPIRDRGDAAWTTGAGGSLNEILNIQPLIPNAIDLANTATWRLGIMLIDAYDDLPSTAEITPGTIDIDRKAIGGTSWASVVSGAACSEAAGLIYYDEAFDSGTGYAEGDSIRITFKSQSISASGNTYEISDATGRMFYTEIRQTMRGTDSAALAATALTNATWTDARAGYLDELGASNIPADLDAVLTDTGTTLPATLTTIEGKVDTVDTNVDAILVDTAEIGAAGAGLSAVPWNANWDAEVESEALDALNTILADSVPADGTIPTLRQAIYMTIQYLNERIVSGTTVTVRKADGSTALYTLTLSDASDPVSITRAS